MFSIVRAFFAALIINVGLIPQIRAETLEQSEGVYCDTAVQIEHFAAYYDADPLNEALDEVNGTAPRACGWFAAAFIRGERLKDLSNQRGTLHVYKVLVIAIWKGRWDRVEPSIQYTAVLDHEERA